jgi:hypothetical protein
MSNENKLVGLVSAYRIGRNVLTGHIAKSIMEQLGEEVSAKVNFTTDNGEIVIWFPGYHEDRICITLDDMRLLVCSTNSSYFYSNAPELLIEISAVHYTISTTIQSEINDMSNTIEFSGYIKLKEFKERDNVLVLSSDEFTPLVERISNACYTSKISLRYWISDSEITEQECSEFVVKQLFGELDADYVNDSYYYSEGTYDDYFTEKLANMIYLKS